MHNCFCFLIFSFVCSCVVNFYQFAQSHIYYDVENHCRFILFSPCFVYFLVVNWTVSDVLILFCFTSCLSAFVVVCSVTYSKLMKRCPFTELPIISCVLKISLNYCMMVEMAKVIHSKEIVWQPVNKQGFSTPTESD